MNFYFTQLLLRYHMVIWASITHIKCLYKLYLQGIPFLKIAYLEVVNQVQSIILIYSASSIIHPFLFIQILFWEYSIEQNEQKITFFTHF